MPILLVWDHHIVLELLQHFLVWMDSSWRAAQTECVEEMSPLLLVLGLVWIQYVEVQTYTNIISITKQIKLIHVAEYEKRDHFTVKIKLIFQWPFFSYSVACCFYTCILIH